MTAGEMIAFDIRYQALQIAVSDLGLNVMTITMLVFVGLLIAISITDIKTMIIPPAYNIAILVLGIISIFTIGQIGLFNRLLGAICVSLPMFLIILVVNEGFGGGDIKLMAAAGFFMGWKTTMLSFMLALIIGGLYGVIVLLLRKKGRKDHFAFGPFLCVGMLVAIFAGNIIVDWYFGLAEKMYLLMY